MNKPEKTRPPGSALERALANCRPQPAIPAVIVFIFFVVIPSAAFSAAGGTGWPYWVMAGGIAASCGLAIAAGFCSLFPQTAWIVLAAWFWNRAAELPLPAPHRILLIAGFVAAGAMIVVQLWRIGTGTFVPTVSADREAS